MVIEGTIHRTVRSAYCVRNVVVIYEGEAESLPPRFKDGRRRSGGNGMECGVGVEKTTMTLTR